MNEGIHKYYFAFTKPLKSDLDRVTKVVTNTIDATVFYYNVSQSNQDSSAIFR